MISQQCALKEWDNVFTQYYWTRETFTDTDSRAKQDLVSALQCEGPKPGQGDGFQFSARSAYGDPKLQGARRVAYRGDTSLLKASRDFSNIMAVDVLIGNQDRFPGGNAFFRSATTSFAQDGTRSSSRTSGSSPSTTRRRSKARVRPPRTLPET